MYTAITLDQVVDQVVAQDCADHICGTQRSGWTRRIRGCPISRTTPRHCPSLLAPRQPYISRRWTILRVSNAATGPWAH